MKIEFNVKVKTMRREPTGRADIHEAADKVAIGEHENVVFRCEDKKEAVRVWQVAYKDAKDGGLKVRRSGCDVYVLKKKAEEE